MRQLTLEERLTCYEEVRSYLMSVYWGFVCVLLEHSYSNITKESMLRGTDITRSHFPEFYAQKPPEKHESEAWFKRGDKESRINALNNAINLIKSKIK